MYPEQKAYMEGSNVSRQLYWPLPSMLAMPILLTTLPIYLRYASLMLTLCMLCSFILCH